MKELSRSYKIFSGAGDFAPVFFKNIAVFLISYIAANTTVSSGMTPFGTAFVAASPPKFFLSSFLGVSAGYIFPFSDFLVFRYIAASAAVIAIKLFIYKMSRDFHTDTWAFITSALLLFLTGAVTGGGNFPSIMNCLTESLIGGACAYCTHFTLAAKKSELGTVKATVSFSVTASVILLGLYNIGFGILSLGCTLSVILLCAAAEFGGTHKGTLCGTLCGFAAFLAGFDGSVALLFALSGAVAGYVAPMGKIAVTSSALVTAISISSLMDFPLSYAEVLTSFTIGSLVYSVIPGKILARAAFLFRKSDVSDGAAGIQKIIHSRLSFAADSLVTVGNMISEVSEKLAAGEKPTFDTVAVGIISEACENCSYFSVCWKSERNNTLRSLEEIAKYEKEFGSIGYIDAESGFSRRCPRKERVEAALVKYYSKFIYEKNADERAREIRSAMKEQYVGLSRLLSSLSSEFGNFRNYNGELSSALSDAVSAQGVKIAGSSCITDEFNRMTVEIKIRSSSDLPISRARLKTTAENICGRVFEIPEVIRADKSFLISMTEKPKFLVNYGVHRIKSPESEISGDTADFFFDGRGKYYLVISDGMGTGKYAAADSGMATGLFYRMICSGFGASCSLKLINSALMYRSYNESLATLDVTEIDLFSGKVNMYKAGSAPTFILRKGNSAKANSKTLPIGILKNVSFDVIKADLSAGDTIVMLSDGATADGCEWITEMIENYEGDSPTELAEKIANKAKEKRRDNHQDDITVIAAFIEHTV